MKNNKLLLCVLVISLGFVGCSSPTVDGGGTTATVTKPVAVQTWQKVITFTGSSIKNTQQFAISSNQWKIVWSTTPTATIGKANFIISVKGPNESVVGNIIGKGNDVSYIPGAGNYSLSIYTAQNYNIVVEQLK